MNRFEPIYGLTKRSLDDWLARNPRLRQQYDEQLAARAQREAAKRAAKTRRTWSWPCRGGLQLLGRRTGGQVG